MQPQNLREAVFELMAQLPSGKVTTYGDLAIYSGHPGAARIVGGIAHEGPDFLPWHRLVHADGRLAVGFPGGVEAQRQLLEQENIMCDENFVIEDFSLRRWRHDL